jgi:hypothetical protein
MASAIVVVALLVSLAAANDGNAVAISGLLFQYTCLLSGKLYFFVSKNGMHNKEED